MIACPVSSASLRSIRCLPRWPPISPRHDGADHGRRRIEQGEHAAEREQAGEEAARRRERVHLHEPDGGDRDDGHVQAVGERPALDEGVAGRARDHEQHGHGEGEKGIRAGARGDFICLGPKEVKAAEGLESRPIELRASLPSFVFHRVAGRDLPTVARASGAVVWDTEGRRYLDGSGGAVVVNVGHGREEIAAAMAGQAAAAGYVHGTQFTSGVLEEYARRLAAHAPGDCRRLYLVSGGSEANETAVKLARAYHLARGEPQRHKVIGRSVSYHGNTLGALSLSGRPTLQAPYLPLLSETPRAAAPFCYHCPLEREYPSLRAGLCRRSRGDDPARRGGDRRRLHRRADPRRLRGSGGAARRLHPPRARDLPPPRHRATSTTR